MLKDCSPGWWYWKVVEPPSGRSLRHSNGTLGPQEIRDFEPLLPECAALPGPKSTKSDHGLKPNTRSKINLLPLQGNYLRYVLQWQS